MRNIFFVGLLILIGSVLGVSVLWWRYKPEIVETVKESVLLAGAPASPIPFPFEDMTVPYLRRRAYPSKLGELKQVSKNAEFTTYLTSYDSDGLRINALLTKPSGKEPAEGWPAIVFVHGYIPPDSYRTQEKYVEYVNGLARNGFVVFKIDLRGHGSSEGEAGGAYYSSDYVIDTLNAYSALENAEFVNAKSIGLWGHSMAGNIILRSAVSKIHVPAIVIWAGAGYSYQDLQEFGIDDNSYRPPSQTSLTQKRRQELFDKWGRFSADSPFWSQVVPTNYLVDFSGAIQLNHAVDDNVVGIEYSRELSELLEKAHIKHELHEYARGGHNIVSPSFTPAMQNTVRFFKENL